MPLTSFDVNWL